MRWRKGRRSSNIEDRRGQGPGRARRMGGSGLKIGGGAGIIMLLISMFLGVDLSGLMGTVGLQRRCVDTTLCRRWSTISSSQACNI